MRVEHLTHSTEFSEKKTHNAETSVCGILAKTPHRHEDGHKTQGITRPNSSCFM